MTRRAIVVIVFLTAGVSLLGACDKDKQSGKPSTFNTSDNGESAVAQEQPNPAENIARDACKGVGVVTRASAGTQGAPIVLLNESHDSRAGQIEHAITLVRLYERHGLRHIGLEGHFKEDPKIEVDWFTKAARGLTETARARVAVRLLQEGEISSAEFMRLVYADMELRPIETKVEYDVELDEEAAAAPMFYLLKLAERSLRREDQPRLEQFQRDIERLEDDAKQKKLEEMLDFILSKDPWVEAKAKDLHDTDAAAGRSIEEHLSILEEIVNRAKKQSLTLDPAEKQAMERHLDFLRARHEASNTMIRSAGDLADVPGVKVVAITTGAAHTEKMCVILEQANRLYAVVTPNSLADRDTRGDMPWGMFERKYRRLSVYSDEFHAALLRALPPESQKKPPPALDQAWFQAKGEIYLSTAQITQRILEPPEPPNDGKPPYGFADDEFRSKLVFIDPKRIEIIEEEGRRAVLFLAVLNPDNPEKRTEIWMKAGLGVGFTPQQDRQSVETMLRKALEDVKAEKEPRCEVKHDTAEKDADALGIFQMSRNLRVGMARTKGTARNMKLW